MADGCWLGLVDVRQLGILVSGGLELLALGASPLADAGGAGSDWELVVHWIGEIWGASSEAPSAYPFRMWPGPVVRGREPLCSWRVITGSWRGLVAQLVRAHA